MIRDILAAFLLIFVVVNARKLPNYITKCKKDNSNADVCMKNAIEVLKPKLAAGLPELGIPPCDPMIIPSIQLSQPQQGNLAFEAYLKTLKFTGGTNFEILKSHIDVQKGIVEISLKFPKLVMEGNYRAKGRLLVVDFQGNGKIDGEFYDVVYTGTWKAEKITKKGKEYFKIIDHKSNVDIRDLKAKFENLMAGNDVVNSQISGVLEENREALYNEVKPAAVSALSGLVSNVINHVLNIYSYNDLFDD